MYELTTTPRIERLKEVYVKLAEAEQPRLLLHLKPSQLFYWPA